MADNRIHPGSNSGREHTSPLSPPPGKLPPLPNPPGTYVIQIAKDQILRPAPPPRRPPHQRRLRRRSCCACCFCGIFFILVLLAALAGVFYAVVRPKPPTYSISRLSIHGFNLTSSTSTVYSPTIDVTVKANNPNNRVGIYYRKASSISLAHSNVVLSKGVLPAFYQPTMNTTYFQTKLSGSGLRFSTSEYNTLIEQQRKKAIPLRLDMKVPVRFRVSSITTWTITFKVGCDITVDKLTRDASIVSSKCDVDLKNIKPWE